MSDLLYSSVIGSGLTTQNSLAAAYKFPAHTFPVPPFGGELRTMQGGGVICLNPENASVSIGIRSQAITVSSSAVPLPASALEFRRSLSIHNNGVIPIYLGYSDVTTSNGFPLAGGSAISIDCQQTPGMTIYAIASGPVDVRIMELA